MRRGGGGGLDCQGLGAAGLVGQLQNASDGFVGGELLQWRKVQGQAGCGRGESLVRALVEQARFGGDEQGVAGRQIRRAEGRGYRRR